jgi:hypothetical protein
MPDAPPQPWADKRPGVPAGEIVKHDFPSALLKNTRTLQSADIVLPTTDGNEIRLRRITEPTAEQKSLLRQLGINLPEHLLQFNRECSVDSAIA